MKKNNINLSEIPTSQEYEGYLWWSDRKKPEVYRKQNLQAWPDENANPFIIEGNLYDEANGKSYLIKFIDGLYRVYCYNLADLRSDRIEFVDKSYLPARFPDDIRKLHFREYWIPETDEFCEEMDVLKPAMQAFVGFNKKEE